MHILQNKKKPAKSLTSIIENRLRQLQFVSDKKLIKDVCSVEKTIWTFMLKSPQSIDLYKHDLNKVVEYYGTVIDTLKYYISIKTKQERLFHKFKNEDETNILMDKFIVMLNCLTSIPDSPGNYLKETVDCAHKEIMNFLNNNMK